MTISISINGGPYIPLASVGGGSSSAGGAVYVYDVASPTSVPATLQSNVGVASYDYGFSVSLAQEGGETGCVLATGQANIGSYGAGVPGHLYSQTRLGSNWVSPDTELVSIGANIGDTYGKSVSISSDASTLVVGASTDVANVTLGAGAIYIWDATTGTGGVIDWTANVKLWSPNPQQTSNFGWSVSMNAVGDTCVVGAWSETPGGNAYVFHKYPDIAAVTPAWVTRSSMIVSRGSGGGSGKIASALASGGASTSASPGFYTAESERYNGTIWSVTGSMAVPRTGHSQVGVSNLSALAAGGTRIGTVTPPADGARRAEKFSGSSWSLAAALAMARVQNASFGTASAAIVTGGSMGTPDYSTFSSEIYNGASFSTGPTLVVGRATHSAVGTVAAGLIWGGVHLSVIIGSTELFNGATFSTGPSMSTNHALGGGSGTATAALATAGLRLTGTYSQFTESWNGTAWSSQLSLPTVLDQHGAAGSSNNSGLVFGGVPGGGQISTTRELLAQTSHTSAGWRWQATLQDSVQFFGEDNYGSSPATPATRYFGTSVAINATGNVCVVGSPDYGVANGGINSGEAYVYTRRDDSWYYLDTISGPSDSIDFGFSVAIDGRDATGTNNNIVVGAPNRGAFSSILGAAFVSYGSNSAAWSSPVKVSSTVYSLPTSEFGSVVSLSADGTKFAVAASPWASDANGVGGAAVEIFGGSPDGGSYASQAILRSPNAATGDLFGRSLSLSANGLWIAVGSLVPAGGAVLIDDLLIWEGDQPEAITVSLIDSSGAPVVCTGISAVHPNISGRVATNSFTVAADCLKLFPRSVAIIDKYTRYASMATDYKFSNVPRDLLALYKYVAPPVQRFEVPVIVTINEFDVALTLVVMANWPVSNAKLIEIVGNETLGSNRDDVLSGSSTGFSGYSGI